MITLIRATYGKKNTPPEMREYRINGAGPVGTIREYKEYFPDEEFEIIDNISGGEK
jgi:hypothetical protein